MMGLKRTEVVASGGADKSNKWREHTLKNLLGVWATTGATRHDHIRH